MVRFIFEKKHKIHKQFSYKTLCIMYLCIHYLLFSELLLAHTTTQYTHYAT